MNASIVRFGLLGLLFLGCNNPFSSDEDIRIIGVWGAQVLGQEIESIAFLDKGRYYENENQVGIYTMVNALYDGEAINYQIRIQYSDGGQVEVVAFTSNMLQINIGNSGGRGPSGIFHRLHSGDGL